MVCRYSRALGSSTNFWMRYVTMVAMVSTKATAAPMPRALSTFFDTPRKGQMPRNCDSTILLTNIAVMTIRMYAITVFFL